MEEKNISERVRELMAVFFSMDPAKISADSSITTIEQWDSLKHLNLIMAIEQEFGIRIDVNDAVEMTSFSNICEKLVSYVGDVQ